MSKTKNKKLQKPDKTSSILSDQIIPVSHRPLVQFKENQVVFDPKSSDYEVVNDNYRGGAAARVRDVFDVMRKQGARARKGKGDHKDPLSPAMVDAGRTYAALFERVNGSGLKCSRCDDAPGGGGSFIDSYRHYRRRLERYHDAIGDGLAMQVRRISAHNMDRCQRRDITKRCLIDMVCLENKPLNAVLMAHGWLSDGKNIKQLKDALCAVLGDMAVVWAVP